MITEFFRATTRWATKGSQPIRPVYSPAHSHVVEARGKSPEKNANNPVAKQAVVFQELAALPTRAERKTLLMHQLGALTNEHLRLPFHTYLLHMSKDQKNKAQLFDPRYAKGSVIDRCQRAIAQAQSPAHADRFTLELQQVETLQQQLSVVLEQAPALAHPALTTLAGDRDNRLTTPNTSSGNNRLATQETAPTELDFCHRLINLGWLPSTSALTPEQARQAQVAPHTQVYLGQKYFYIMPQSSIHDGEMSMYLLAQPAYIPATNTWVVLQEQLFEAIPWETHTEALNRAKTTQFSPAEQVRARSNQTAQTKPEHSDGTQPRTHRATSPNISRALPATATPTPPTEASIMSHCIELDASFQLTSARQTLIHLLGDNSSTLVAKHKDLVGRHQALMASLEHHAEYLLSIQELDSTWEHGWSDQKANRLSQALFNTLSSIYHTQPVTPHQTQEWIAQYQKLYGSATNRSKASDLGETLRKATSQNTPWLAESISSKLECFSVSAAELTRQMGNNGLNQLSLNGDLLSNSMSSEDKAAFGKALEDFLPLRFSNGETWYVPKEYFAEYAQGSRVLNGVVVGPCYDTPFTQDNLVLSEKSYLSLKQRYLDSQQASLQTGKQQALDHVLQNLSTEQEKEEAQRLLTAIEELLVVKSLGLQQFISGEVLAYEGFVRVPELLNYYHRLLTTSHPLRELRAIVMEVFQSGENTVKSEYGPVKTEYDIGVKSAGPTHSETILFTAHELRRNHTRH